MVKIEEFLSQWQSTREGLINEAERIPEDKLDFRATGETRSVIELLYHVIESERRLIDEICRDDTDLKRLFTQSPDTEVRVVTSKNAIISLLRSSLVSTSEKVTKFGEENFDQLVTGFDGNKITKMTLLQFTLSHEMYHRGQLTVYQRLLGIEPALTELFRRFTSSK
jgi:uncharacterized damage-inducible protein DinB